MNTPTLESLWSELSPSILSPDVTAASDVARARLAYFAGATAVLAILERALNTGEAAVVDALNGVKAELLRETRR